MIKANWEKNEIVWLDIGNQIGVTWEMYINDVHDIFKYHIYPGMSVISGLL